MESKSVEIRRISRKLRNIFCLTNLTVSVVHAKFDRFSIPNGYTMLKMLNI